MQVDEMENSGDERETEFYDYYIPRMIGAVFSSALTGFFALAGACTGAVTGALAGKASHSGLIRGAGLGAVAGAILSLEVLKASRAYWCSDRSGSRISSPMADFVEELFHGRFVEEPFSPPVSITYHWQVSSIANIHDGVHNNSEVASKGLSSKSLRELPCHIVRNEVTPSQRTCCTICLQDFELGDMVRSLPWCLHTFHLTCVDKWLIQHGSCPICRQHVQL